MTHTYDHSAKKKPTNLSINSDLLTKAKVLKLNISATLESALANEVQKLERAQWLQQNKEAIAASNKLTESKGLFSTSYKTI